MIISVASGKGGTGKTTVASSLSLSLVDLYGDVTYVDCDVEEPNGHLLLNPILQRGREISLKVPVIDTAKCDFCGYCAEICAFNALAILPDNPLVFTDLCHSCRGCWMLCHQKAIKPVHRKIGVVEAGSAESLKFVQGRLDVGIAISPPLIEAVKSEIEGKGVYILDCPPGTSCPVVKAVEGSDFCLLVTESSPFGLHDLKMAVELIKNLNIPMGVAVNRSDGQDIIIENYCKENGIPLLLKLPFQRLVAEAYAHGKNAVEVNPEWKKQFRDLYASIGRMVEK